MYLTRSSGLRGLAAALALCCGMAGSANARVFIGVGVPLFAPFVVPPPVYYPPYYAPPPMVYAPPGNTFSYTPPSAQPQSLAPPGGYARRRGHLTCRAGAYVCPLIESTPRGGECGCPGHEGQWIVGRAG